MLNSLLLPSLKNVLRCLLIWEIGPAVDDPYDCNYFFIVISYVYQIMNIDLDPQLADD